MFADKTAFKLTFHLVQYKILYNVDVKIQIMYNCTTSMGQTKAQKLVFSLCILVCFRGPPTALLPLSLTNFILLGNMGEKEISPRAAEA